MGKNLTFLGDLEDRNKVPIFAPSISCGWRNKMPFFKVLHTYQINRCPKFLTATKAWGFFVFGDWHSAVIQGDILAAVSNPLQGCIKRCTETCRECDRGESNLDSHHERNETDEVLRPCWFAHSLKTDSRSVEIIKGDPCGSWWEIFFLHFCLRDSLSMYGSTIGCSVVYIFNIYYTVSIK